MKFIGEKARHKTVLYFGIALFITSDIKWIAVDEDGSLWGFSVKPILCEASHDWSHFNGFSIELGDVDLEGMDWRDTLREFA